jgi:hypothetical protein
VTTYIGTSPSTVVGAHTYYRVTFDVSGQGLFFATSSKLNYVYEHIQDTGAVAPLSANPVSSGDDVMVVDVYPIAGGASLSVAEVVRRLETVAGHYAGAGDTIRSIQKLGSINDVTAGADDRDAVADAANKSNDEDSFEHKVADFFAGLGHFTTLAVIGVVAYAVIVASPALSAFARARRK